VLKAAGEEMKTEEQPLRIGIIGAGGIVRSRHAPALGKIPGVELVAVANSSEASARAFVEDFCPAARVYGRWEELAAAKDLDVIWVGATPHLHESATLAGLEAGHHVFCQARMAPNLAAAERMLAAAEARPDLVTMLCPPPFGLAEDGWVRRVLAEHGAVRQVYLRSWDGAWREPSSPIHWRQRRDLSGENIMTLGIFTEVLQRWLGKVERVQARGKVWTAVRGGALVEIPDVVELNVGWSGGATGQWSFSGIYPGKPRHEVEFQTEEWVLRFDFVSGELSREGTNGGVEKLSPREGELRPWRVEADFIAAVRNPAGPRPEPSFRTGVSYMRVVDAVARALRSGSEEWV
jgi:predicted dehydrogenase